ncbi:GH3 auxin-responsive promoter family protein [Catalinimonas alkaloidigena]|nr:GH3 auxin-responsive promoter family protein [Catalinimonas alkaloidigena]
MAILGSVIKGVIQLRDTLTGEEAPFAERQRKSLTNLLEKAKDTAFGKHYDFASILKSDNLTQAFAERVPLHDYDKLHDAWWHRSLEGETDVCWPGKIEYFALTSGTSGSVSKHIPVTQDMIDAIRNTGIRQVWTLAHYDLPADFFEKGILMLGSSIDLEEKDGYAQGEISGISARNIPAWFDGFYKPGKEIAKIDDWEERLQKIAEEAPNWDIGALSGIPAWIQLMLERVIEHHNLNNIHDIWPHLSVYTTGGIAFEPYRKTFEKLLARPLIYLDTYLASEGFMAFQSRPNDRMAMELIPDEGIFFEFIPFGSDTFDDAGLPREGVKPVPIEEVDTETDYALVISTCAGTWRYLIGDTIKFTDPERAEIIISGRTKHYMDVAGSHLSVDNMNDAMRHLEEKHNLTIPEFAISAEPFEEHFAHRWFVGTEQDVDKETLRESLDAFLSEKNKNYRMAREKALKQVYVEVVKPEVFYEWLEKNKKKGGQIKMPRVLKGDQLDDWREFAGFTAPATQQ